MAFREAIRVVRPTGTSVPVDRVSLDALTFPQGDCTPDDMAHIVLALSAEIKRIIRAEKTTH